MEFPLQRRSFPTGPARAFDRRAAGRTLYICVRTLEAGTRRSASIPGGARAVRAAFRTGVQSAVPAPRPRRSIQDGADALSDLYDTHTAYSRTLDSHRFSYKRILTLGESSSVTLALKLKYAFRHAMKRNPLVPRRCADLMSRERADPVVHLARQRALVTQLLAEACNVPAYE